MSFSFFYFCLSWLVRAGRQKETEHASGARRKLGMPVGKEGGKEGGEDAPHHHTYLKKTSKTLVFPLFDLCVTDGRTNGRTDGRTNRQMDGQSLF